MLLLLYDVPIKFTNRPRIFIESMSMFLLFFFCVFIWCIQCYLLVVFGFFKNNTQMLWNFVMTTFFFYFVRIPITFTRKLFRHYFDMSSSFAVDIRNQNRKTQKLQSSNLNEKKEQKQHKYDSMKLRCAFCENMHQSHSE